MTFSNIPVIFLIKTPREMVWWCVGDDVPPPLLTDKLVMVRGKCSARLPPARSPGLTGQQSRGFPSTFSNLRTLTGTSGLSLTSGNCNCHKAEHGGMEGMRDRREVF